MKFYRIDAADYLRNMAGLSMLEEGAFRRLLDAYYATERPLPKDLKACYRIARACNAAELKSAKAVILKFFTLTGQGRVHRGADREIARYKAKQNQARASANARWNPAARTSQDIIG